MDDITDKVYVSRFIDDNDEVVEPDDVILPDETESDEEFNDPANSDSYDYSGFSVPRYYTINFSNVPRSDYSDHWFIKSTRI